MTRGLASLGELQTTYTLEDAFDLYEVIAVNNHNERVAMAASKASRGHGRR